jgi:hypothetical protein
MDLPESSAGVPQRPDPSLPAGGRRVCDRPATDLAPPAERNVDDTIALAGSLRVSAVVTSHDMACAPRIADRSAVLLRGTTGAPSFRGAGCAPGEVLQ